MRAARAKVFFILVFFFSDNFSIKRFFICLSQTVLRIRCQNIRSLTIPIFKEFELSNKLFKISYLNFWSI